MSSTSSSSVGQLETAALKRKAKLAELRAKKARADGKGADDKVDVDDEASALPA